MGVGGKRHAPAALPPGMTRYPLYRRLGRAQTRSGRVLKISPPQGLDLRTIQLVASRYTDWTIPALLHLPYADKLPGLHTKTAPTFWIPSHVLHAPYMRSIHINSHVYCRHPLTFRKNNTCFLSYFITLYHLAQAPICTEPALFREPDVCYSVATYRVIQKERSLCGEVIVSVIVRKNVHMNMCLILSG